MFVFVLTVAWLGGKDHFNLMSVWMCMWAQKNSKRPFMWLVRLYWQATIYWVFCFYIPVCGHGTYRYECLYDNMPHTSLAPFLCPWLCAHKVITVVATYKHCESLEKQKNSLHHDRRVAQLLFSLLISRPCGNLTFFKSLNTSNICWQKQP